MKRRNRCKAKLRLYPDPILKAVCEPVGDGEDVSDVIRDMMHILTNSKTGVGLAAPQAGHTKRIIVVHAAGCRAYAMINPEITDASDDTEIEPEGCLSYPGIYKPVKRFWGVMVKYRDEDGVERQVDFCGFIARIIQHEIDHLDGKCKIGE